jgi:hypothetical protein
MNRRCWQDLPEPRIRTAAYFQQQPSPLAQLNRPARQQMSGQLPVIRTDDMTAIQENGGNCKLENICNFLLLLVRCMRAPRDNLCPVTSGWTPYLLTPSIYCMSVHGDIMRFIRVPSRRPLYRACKRPMQNPGECRCLQRHTTARDCRGCKLQATRNAGPAHLDLLMFMSMQYAAV